MLDLSWTTYYHQTVNAISLTALFGGVFKSVIYGVLIALCGMSARHPVRWQRFAAVGEAATSAVVTSIVFIVAACGAMAVVFYIIGV